LQEFSFECESYSQYDKEKKSLAIPVKLTVKGLYMPSPFQSYVDNKNNLPFMCQKSKKLLWENSLCKRHRYKNKIFCRKQMFLSIGLNGRKFSICI